MRSLSRSDVEKTVEFRQNFPLSANHKSFAQKTFWAQYQSNICLIERLIVGSENVLEQKSEVWM